jgi:hypothetical protein
MKHALLTLAACSALLAGPAGARDTGAAKNTAATRAYYAQLIAGDQPRLAELGLMMNLLPKGADLHHHYSGALYAETYLDWLGRKGYCMYTADDAAKNQQAFRINTAANGAGPDCLSADAIRANNHVYRQMLMRWSDKDFGNHSHAQNPPDEQFFDTFGFFGPVSDQFSNEGLRTLKQYAKAENVQYLETMYKSAPVTVNAQLAPAVDALTSASSDAQIEAALTAYADFMAADPAAKKQLADYVAMVEQDAGGIDDAEFTMRFQTYAVRLLSPSKVFTMLYNGMAADTASRLLVGVNIVGAENTIVSMRDYALHMKMIRFLKKRFPEAHLALHAGELAVGMVPPAGLRFHIRDAVEVGGAERIGHGVDITQETDAIGLMAQLKAKNIPVEINLTSNQFILGVQGAAHPLPVYMRHGVPFVISSDDPGVSRNMLSGEYALFASRYKPSYDVVKKAAYDSIRYSFLSAQEKTAQLRMLDQRYARFEAEMAKVAAKK